MEFKEIKEILELFSKSNIDKLDLQQDEFSLKLDKKRNKVVTAKAIESVPVVTDVPVAALPAPAEDEDEGLVFVTSPIVGTFYRAANPTADPFVKVGDTIQTGNTLCIVEAMKLMNEIQADHTGTVVKILAENGEGVEFGQKLFAIKP